MSIRPNPITKGLMRNQGTKWNHPKCLKSSILKNAVKHYCLLNVVDCVAACRGVLDEKVELWNNKERVSLLWIEPEALPWASILQ